jgi:acyl-CoA hydrolase
MKKQTSSSSSSSVNGKSPKDSQVTMTEIVLPSDANALGTIFGGKIMAWISVHQLGHGFVTC